MMTEAEALLALDAAWNAAYPACDTAALDQILAADWTAIAGAGRIVDKARLLEAVGAGPSPFAQQRFYETRLRLLATRLS